MSGVEDVEAGDAGRDRREVLRIVEGGDYENPAHAADLEGHEVVVGKGGCIFLRAVRNVAWISASGLRTWGRRWHVFGEIDEVLTSKLPGIDEGGHFDHGGEGEAGSVMLVT